MRMTLAEGTLMARRLRTWKSVTILLRIIQGGSFLWHRIKEIILRINHSPAVRNNAIARANSKKAMIWADGKMTGKPREVRNATAKDNSRKATKWVNPKVPDRVPDRARVRRRPAGGHRSTELLSKEERVSARSFLFLRSVMANTFLQGRCMLLLRSQYP